MPHSYFSDILQQYQQNSCSFADVITACSQQYQTHQQQIQQQAIASGDIGSALLAHSQCMDELLKTVWQMVGLPYEHIALFAIGGYGRQELFPSSDIDMFILLDLPHSPLLEQKISQFISNLWDIKQFKPAISVRTFQQCIEDAKQDLSFTTALLETRLLIGSNKYRSYPRKIIAQTWTDEAFYHGKMQEQEQRHSQHRLNAVEPDIKQAVGGLRDIHQIAWITKRHFRVKYIADLCQLGFLSEQELNTLQHAEQFLWKVRYYLHLLTQRDENRLLFDYQQHIAEKFGFIQQADDTPNQAIEQFMKQYYRIAQQVSSLNEILLAYFYESVIMPRNTGYQRKIVHLNREFKLVDGRLAVQHHRVFTKFPHTILELFYFWISRDDILGIRARTLRLLAQSIYLIDDAFRQNQQHHAIFLKIIRSRPEHLYRILVAMKRYGVLERYIPAFEQITGLMQYDLFHIYTVDAHTLLVMRTLNRFKSTEFSEKFPVVSAVYQQLPRYDVLFLAGLFHDIAKGRQGDHSILGAEDAFQFCRLHGLSEDDAEFIAWLIRHHLVMSITAQKHDISNPEVVQQFAKTVGDIRHLDYLYCLTVADINATNPKLWNSWRASLMRQLYLATKAIIQAGIEQPINHQQVIQHNKHQAKHALQQYSTEQIDNLWQKLGDDYFLKENPDEIIWHTQAILQHHDYQPLILMRSYQPEHSERQDMLQIFIYTPDQPNLFAKTVMVLDRMDLDVQSAKIITADTGFSLDTYVVLDRYATLVDDMERQNMVRQALFDALHQTQPPKIKQRRVPRQLRHFNVHTQVNIQFEHTLKQHKLDVITLDQPGLLAKMGEIFIQHRLAIHSARIATFGERAEDSFFISQDDGQALDEQHAHEFGQQLKLALEQFSQQIK